MRSIKQITIIGPGLLGGSIGLGLRGTDFNGRIIGVSRRETTLHRALKRGCIDESHTQLSDGVANSDLVILATPVGSFANLMDQCAAHLQGGAIVTDVGSTKSLVCKLAAERLHKATPFVGSHPMAGSEQTGPEAARADLFQGATCIVTPTNATDSEAIETIESLWNSLGMRVVHMSPEEHDRVVARVSHLPHALATLIMQLADHRGGLDVAATGFRDITRIASGDPQMWHDIFTSNREAVVESLGQFTDELATLMDILNENNDEALLDHLKRAKAARDAWVQQFRKRN